MKNLCTQKKNFKANKIFTFCDKKTAITYEEIKITFEKSMLTLIGNEKKF